MLERRACAEASSEDRFCSLRFLKVEDDGEVAEACEVWSAMIRGGNIKSMGSTHAALVAVEEVDEGLGVDVAGRHDDRGWREAVQCLSKW